MVNVIDGRRTVAIGMVRSKSLQGSVGIACLTADLAKSVADEVEEAEEAEVEGFSLWSSLGKRFDNIVVYIHDDRMGTEERAGVAEEIENLVARLSGPDGKVYVVV